MLDVETPLRQSDRAESHLTPRRHPDTYSHSQSVSHYHYHTPTMYQRSTWSTYVQQIKYTYGDDDTPQ